MYFRKVFNPVGMVVCRQGHFLIILKMASKSVSVTPSDVGGDDFTQIKGIGPSIARRLYAAGILTYKHLSRLSPSDLSSRISGVSTDRIERQGWVRQAARLSAKSGIQLQRGNQRNSQRVSQRYATFVVELLLNEDSSVRRTKIAYIQGAVEKSWIGWQEAHLVKFMARNSGLRDLLTKRSSNYRWKSAEPISCHSLPLGGDCQESPGAQPRNINTIHPVQLPTVGSSSVLEPISSPNSAAISGLGGSLRLSMDPTIFSSGPVSST